MVAIDVQLDTATEAGWLTAGALAQVGGWETREDLDADAARPGRGAARGRPSVADVPELRERIVGMRESGMTLQAIADVLNEEGVPTLRGGSQWRPSSVQAAPPDTSGPPRAPSGSRPSRPTQSADPQPALGGQRRAQRLDDLVLVGSLEVREQRQRDLARGRPSRRAAGVARDCAYALSSCSAG